MDKYSIGVMLLLVLVLGGFFIAAMNSKMAPGQSSEPVEGEVSEAPVAPLSVARQEDVETTSMTGWGIFIAAVGFLGSSAVALMFDVSPYGELVNIDLVSQRDMAFTAGAALAVIGVVISCAGRIVNTIRLRG